MLPFSSKFSVRTRSVTPRRKGALWGGVLLLAGAVAWLYFHAGFAWYALTGSLWKHAEGTVVSAGRTPIPTVQFTARDGLVYQFSEDYIQLCGGRRDFCLIRTFVPGQAVPVVYDPLAPRRAFIHDWALFENVGSWFLMALVSLLLAWMIWIAFSGKPANITVSLGSEANLD